MLLDNGRTQTLADEVGRQALHCIRCSACLNVCPVYSRTGGQAYESVYPGPIGAILTPQLRGLGQAPTLPWASSLCGACYEACPVKIDIPSVLIHLRGRVVREEKKRTDPERLAMDVVGKVFSSRKRYEGAQKLSKLGRGPLGKLPVPGWSTMRELPEVPDADVPGVVAWTPGLRSCSGFAPPSATARPCPTSRATTTGRARRPPTSTCSASASPTTRRPCTAWPPAMCGGWWGRSSPSTARSGWRGRSSRRLRARPTTALSTRELDALDGVITGCALGIAETGTIVLDGARALRPPRADARARPAPVRDRRGADRRLRARRGRAPRRGGPRRAPDHAGVGAFGDVGYRA